MIALKAKREGFWTGSLWSGTALKRPIQKVLGWCIARPIHTKDSIVFIASYKHFHRQSINMGGRITIQNISMYWDIGIRDEGL